MPSTLVLLTASILYALPATAAATTADAASDLAVSDFADLSLDALLTEDIMVSTSGKQEQKLSEVGEAVWVLTAEQIRRSGATNVAEALRLVPGIDVTQITPAHYEVSTRFHESQMANNLLLLIDSRPSYINFFKSNMWTSLPVVLEEIERI